MDNSIKYISRRWRLSLVLLAAGVILAIAGALLPRLVGPLPINPKLVTALGILAFGVGLGIAVRYGSGLKNPAAARRLVSEEQDERQAILRGRAGFRAFLAAEALAYILLMIVSLNAYQDPLADALWYALAVIVLAPFAVYAISLSYDEKHS
jgi:membrane protease YdiL (CAAX protease family)